MQLQPNFLRPQEIEQEARRLLVQFAAKKGSEVKAPIPIEEIIENFLGLSLEISEMEDSQLLGYYDAFNNVVAVNSELEPEGDDNFGKIGCFNFTLGHEGGHHRLHRYLILDSDSQGKLKMKPGIENPRIICRRPERREPVEIQANQFSACLLMPKKLVMQEWEKLMADCNSSSFQPTDSGMVLELRKTFRVSKQAMGFRLQDLGLSVQEYQAQGRLI